MSEAVADEPLVNILPRGAWIGLAIGLAALGLTFHAEIDMAVRTWINSTAYNHCFLVVPIVAYMIWDRRESLRGLMATPKPIVALLALPIGLAWLAAERLGVMEGRQLMAVSMAEVLFLAILGPRLWRAVSGPLLYLYFLVPFGAFLTPKLQDFTTWFIRHGVDILGIPAYIDGYVIDIPEGSFFVAEACAGLRFLIASIAFGVLYTLLMYRSPGRRVLFVVASIIIPVIANGFRALGIVVLGRILGSAQAAATDHILYGWIFFSVVILLLILLGLPFRQDEQPYETIAEPMTPDEGVTRTGLITGLAVAVAAAIAPLITLELNQASAAPNLVVRALDFGPSCTAAGTPTPPANPTPGHSLVQAVDCGGTPMTVQVEVFSPHVTAAPITAERRRLTRPVLETDDLAESQVVADGQPLRPWRMFLANDPAFVAAAGMWIDGQPTPPGMAMRLRMARSSLFGDDYAPVLVVLIPQVDWAHIDTRQKKALLEQVTSVLHDNPSIADQVRAIAGAR